MTIYLVIALPKYRIYTAYKWFWPTLLTTHRFNVYTPFMTIYLVIALPKFRIYTAY